MKPNLLFFAVPLALLSSAAGPCTNLPIGSLDSDAGATADAQAQAPAPNAPVPSPQAPDAQAASTVGCGGASTPTTPDPCAPAVVSSEPETPGGPQCRCIIGFYWNGTACPALGGCKCVGECQRLYADEAKCRADHAVCGPGGTRPDASSAAPSCDPLAGSNLAEYVATLDDGRWIVVTRPRDNPRYEDFRLFLGASPEQMIERRVTSVLRARDGGSTQIQFEIDGASAFAQFPPPDGAVWLSPGTPRLEAGGRTTGLMVLAPNAAIPSFRFVCR